MSSFFNRLKLNHLNLFIRNQNLYKNVQQDRGIFSSNILFGKKNNQKKKK